MAAWDTPEVDWGQKHPMFGGSRPCPVLRRTRAALRRVYPEIRTAPDAPNDCPSQPALDFFAGPVPGQSVLHVCVRACMSKHVEYTLVESPARAVALMHVKLIDG